MSGRAMYTVALGYSMDTDIRLLPEELYCTLWCPCTAVWAAFIHRSIYSFYCRHSHVARAHEHERMRIITLSRLWSSLTATRRSPFPLIQASRKALLLERRGAHGFLAPKREHGSSCQRCAAAHCWICRRPEALCHLCRPFVSGSW